jgi:(p)ppGpp synthase/HD superfamily hydrolase
MDLIGTPSWRRAASHAARAHQGQLRKDKETPYVAHPFRVAMTVRHVFGIDDEVALCAALLHDTIEDTTTDYDDLLKGYGLEVAEAVATLTKDTRLPEERREAEYLEALGRGTWQVRVVKLADTYDNVCDAHEPALLEKASAKARRVMSVVGDDDPRLTRAKEALRSLLARRGVT